MAIIILTKCDLVRIDVDPVLDRHAGSIGGHRQCCEHSQYQYKAQQHFFVFHGSSFGYKMTPSVLEGVLYEVTS